MRRARLILFRHHGLEIFGDGAIAPDRRRARQRDHGRSTISHVHVVERDKRAEVRLG